MFKVGMDTGGTFTDLMIVEEGGEIRLLKTLSTPQDPFQSVLTGLKRAAEESRMGKKWGYTVYDYKIPFPNPLVPGNLRFGVNERIRYNGEVVTPLSESDVKAAIATFKKHGVQSIAICF